MLSLDFFDAIWSVDFEFTARSGERPEPICMVAREHRSRATRRLGPDELRARSEAPFDVGTNALFVAYFASAELSCFEALRWPFPQHVLDLYVEYSNRTNGYIRPFGRSLLGATKCHGIDGIASLEKDEMRQLAMRGGDYSADEIQRLIAYCETDVAAVDALLASMAPFELGHALLRGRYMKAVARMEALGVPMDTETLERLTDGWDAIRRQLIAEVGDRYEVCGLDGIASYGLYDGTAFRSDRFADYLAQSQIPWPHHPSGLLDLTDDTFRSMAKLHPELSELRELRHALSQLRLADLSVGKDGRNRVMLSPFQSKTGRNQPSTSKFIFGSSVWLRGLIQPSKGMALAYLDWSGQEYGIAAALSEDPAMRADYTSGDPYLAFAKNIGMAPPDATKKSHAPVRESFKVALGLGAMYGAGANTVAEMIGKPVAYASHLLREHRVRYPRFWRWRDAAVDHAMLHGTICTVFGWNIAMSGNTTRRSLANFPMQGNGAEMMRLACIFATEAGIKLCCPVHDALLVEAPTEEIDAVVADTRRLMAQASRIVLGGFELRTGVDSVVYPDRYRDQARGGAMWDRVMRLIS